MLYLPVIYENGEQKPFNQPFFLADSGRVIYFEHYRHDSTESFAAYLHWRNVRYKPANIETADKFTVLTGRWLFENTASSYQITRLFLF
jgi:hypothetical protein